MDEIRRRQISFWSTWVLANALGASIGWTFGELAGIFAARIVETLLAGILAWLIFEGSIWAFRMAALSRLKELRPLTPIDAFLWIIVESFGWLAIPRTVGGGTYWHTAGAAWALMMGAFMWIVIWLIRVPRPTRWWALAASFRALTAMILGSAVVSFGLLISLELRDLVARTFPLILGWAIAGIALGGFVGAVTGLAFLRILRWRSLPTPGSHHTSSGAA